MEHRIYRVSRHRSDPCDPAGRCDEYGFLWKELWGGIKKAAKKVAKAAEKVIEPVLHKANTVAVAVGIDTAEISALLLNMKLDKKRGIYYAKFDCWQQYFGYNDFYDIMFEIGTDMDADNFPFVYNKKNYILGAWKGDYITLGAGAEMGIYYGGGVHWRVDKALAMPMTLYLNYKGRQIVYHSQSTWWVTGFNPNYFNVKARDLTAVYRVDFSSNEKTKNLFRAFKSTNQKHWTFYSSIWVATSNLIIRVELWGYDEKIVFNI